jgi:hypothetical protein
MPNFIITEYFLPFEELGQRLCPNVLRPVDGYIALPEGPGLGASGDFSASSFTGIFIWREAIRFSFVGDGAYLGVPGISR